nr:hypothetical protein [Ardenticatena sp.]
MKTLLLCVLLTSMGFDVCVQGMQIAVGTALLALGGLHTTLLIFRTTRLTLAPPLHHVRLSAWGTCDWGGPDGHGCCPIGLSARAYATPNRFQHALAAHEDRYRRPPQNPIDRAIEDGFQP